MGRLNFQTNLIWNIYQRSENISQFLDQSQSGCRSIFDLLYWMFFIWYYLQLILMRTHYHKVKSNPFSSIRNDKNKPVNSSLDKAEYMVTLNAPQLPSEERMQTKYRNKSFVRGKDSSANLDIGTNLSFKDLGKELKSKRTLVEENEDLKKKLETLMHNKSSRRGSVAKKLSTQFEKEIYWNGSQSYMISGIKLQYQKMKESYLKKSEDYEDLMRSAVVANNMEFLAYIEALEVENHILARQLQATRQKGSQEDQSKLVLQLLQRVANYQAAITQQRQRNKRKGGQLKKLRSKIAFLEKLVISKDNNEHLAHKNMKKIEKEKVELQKKIVELEEIIHLMGKDHQHHVSKIESYHKQNLQLQLNKQASSHKEQHQNITRLMRENRYLQSLIDSWKAEKNPQKEHKEREQRDSHNHHHFHHKDSTRNKEHTVQSHNEIPADNKAVLKRSTHKEQISHQKHPHHREDPSSEEDLPRREPYSADHKNSENSVKNRRVQVYQIEEIVEFYRFQLIACGQSVEWLLEKFQAHEEDAWGKEYISMGEARHTLQHQLRMGQPQSLLLARYLIEHSNNEFVYTDELNQYSRPVVKSILKSLFGNYSIYSNQKTDFQQILQVYRSKLELMLESTTKGGVISRDKFNDLLQSLSINCKGGFDIWCIARMAQKSQSLQKLQYKWLFEGMRLND